MSAQSQRVSFRQDKPFNPRKRQKLPHPMDSSFLTRGKNDLMQRGKSDLIRTRVHRVLEISRPADRRDAIYRTREWGDTSPNQRGKNDLKKIPHATFFGDPNQRGKSDLVPDFLGAAGDKSPVLYREQGLWDAPPVELELTSVIIIPRPADRGDAIYRTRATSFLQSMK